MLQGVSLRKLGFTPSVIFPTDKLVTVFIVRKERIIFLYSSVKQETPSPGFTIILSE